MKRFFIAGLVILSLGAGCAKPNDLPTSSPTSENNQELVLSQRGLTAIPANVFTQTGLVRLDLSRNALTGAPPSEIGRLQNLRVLDLSHNQLTGLPAEIGQLSHLEELNVSNNRLTGLPLELGNLSQLRVLDVSGNAYSAQDLAYIADKLRSTEIRR